MDQDRSPTVSVAEQVAGFRAQIANLQRCLDKGTDEIWRLSIERNDLRNEMARCRCDKGSGNYGR